ncbi:MAG: DUF4815 domain-containing protein [Acidobacteriota bacterium]|nr:DUF4815 domain-containing protein [Acidobacteriota bacterium]
MKADISRSTFDPGKHYLRVLMQQGRVQLDADFNEQAAILLHYLQTLAADLIGPFGGPAAGAGFEIKLDPNPVRRYHLSPGRYYVDGLLVENEGDLDSGAAGSLLPRLPDGRRSLLYLDVWEREVLPVEDGRIREVALGGLDTALRSQLVWRVRAIDKRADGSDIPETRNGDAKDWQAWLGQWQPANRGRLRAAAHRDPKDDNACLAAPEARYHGAENQLYRVEVHRGGTMKGAIAPTFKWSRDNGSVIFPVLESAGDTVGLEHLGRDSRSGLKPGDWVEFVDVVVVAQEAGDPLTLFRVEAVDPRRTTVRLQAPKPDNQPQPDVPEHDGKSAFARHAFLRRWDHQEIAKSQGGTPLQNGALRILEGENDAGWIALEDGIRIQFQPDGIYRAGDYWLIPARTATGDVEWTQGEDGRPEARKPYGADHHFAPLAVVEVDGAGKLEALQPLRKLFAPLEP